MTLEYLLKLSAGPFTSPLKQARNELGQFTAQTKQMGSAGTQSVNQLGGAFGGLAMKIAAAFTAWKAGEAVFSGFKKSIGLAADAETTAVAFKTLVGSAELAKDVLGKVKKMADTTPFEFPELAGAARMLVAFGEAAKDVPATLQRLGDVASGVAAPVGEIAEIYGKARTQNQLFAEDINQLTGRGIPIISELAKVLGKPESAIKKLAEEGKITFPLLDQAFRNMTEEGGKFYHMMQEQSGTTNGLLSTLHDGVNNLFKKFGEPLNDAIKPILNDAISLCTQLEPVVKEVGVHMGEAMTAVRNFVAEAKSGGGLAAAMGQKLKEAFFSAADVAAVPFRAIGAALPHLGSAFMAVVTPAGEWLMLKMENAALLFGRIMMRQMAEVMAALPMKMGEAAAQTLNKSANNAGKLGNMAGAQAKEVAAGMPEALSDAVAGLEGAMAAAQDKLKAEMARLGGKDGVEQGGPGAAPLPSWERPQEPTTKEKAKGLDTATANANATKVDKNAAKRDDKQEKARDYQEKELQIDRARAAGDTAKATAMEKYLKMLKEADSIQEKTGVSEAEALKQAREKAALQDKIKGMANATQMVPKDVKAGHKPKADDGSPHKIHGYSMKQGGRYMESAFKRRDASGVTMDSLMNRRASGLGNAMQSIKLSAPGAAKNAQARREAAATAAQGGEHPLAGLLKDVAGKLGKLAIA